MHVTIYIVELLILLAQIEVSNLVMGFVLSDGAEVSLYALRNGLLESESIQWLKHRGRALALIP